MQAKRCVHSVWGAVSCLLVAVGRLRLEMPLDSEVRTRCYSSASWQSSTRGNCWTLKTFTKAIAIFPASLPQDTVSAFKLQSSRKMQNAYKCCRCKTGAPKKFSKGHKEKGSPLHMGKPGDYILRGVKLLLSRQNRLGEGIPRRGSDMTKIQSHKIA